MSDENKALIRRWFEEVWTPGRTAALVWVSAQLDGRYGFLA
jgi:hypothetical protein